MDAARARPLTRDGPGLRGDEIDKKKSLGMGGLAGRTPSGCPYGLGAACPLVEIVQGGALARRRFDYLTHALAVVVGLGISAAAVLFIYY